MFSEGRNVFHVSDLIHHSDGIVSVYVCLALMLSDYAEPGTLEDCRLMPEGLIMVLHSHLWHCLLDMGVGLHLCRWL